MKLLIEIALGALLLCLGCGTNLGEEARLADARSQCEELQPPPAVLNDWGTGVALLRTWRDDGMPGSEAAIYLFDACEETFSSTWGKETCFNCEILMIDAVWP